MAAFHGKLGSVTFSGDAILNVTSWSINATAKVSESTAMNADDGAKTYLAGYLNWTATVEGILEDTETPGGDPDPTTDIADSDGAALVLYGSTAGGELAKKYSGTAIVTSISYRIDKNDVEKITYSFQGSGELAEATDS